MTNGRPYGNSGSMERSLLRTLPLEGKLSPKVTDEVAISLLLVIG